MPYKKYEESVDEILENLKQQPRSTTDAAVDNILADLGLEGPSAVSAAVQPRTDPAAASSFRSAVAQPPKQQKPQPPKPQQPPKAQKPAAPQPSAPAAPSDAQQRKQRFEQTADTQEDDIRPPSLRVSESLRVNELMDEEFTRFFSETVAVVPEEETEPVHRKSLFDRFIRKRKEERYPEAEEDENVLMPDQSDPDDPIGEMRLGDLPEEPLPEDEDEDTYEEDVYEDDIYEDEEEAEPSEPEKTYTVPELFPQQVEEPTKMADVAERFRRAVQSEEEASEEAVDASSNAYAEVYADMIRANEAEAGESCDAEVQFSDEIYEEAAPEETAIEEEDTRPIDLELLKQHPDRSGKESASQEEEEKPRRGPRLFGGKEPQNEEGPFEEPEEEEQVSDYEKPEDAPAVQADLAGRRTGLGLRAALTGILGIVLLYLGFMAAGVLPMIKVIDPGLNPVPYLAVNLILLLVCMGLSWDVMRDGIIGVAGTPSGQTFPALASIGALVQMVTLMLKSADYVPGELTLFTGPAALLLCMSLVGRAMMGGVVERNFDMVSRGIDHAAAYRVRSRELTSRVAVGLGEPSPSLLVSRPTGLVKGFLRQSFSQAPSDWLAQKMSWALLGSAILSGILAMVRGYGVVDGLSGFAGTLVLGSPLCCTLLSAVPCLMMQKSAARVGAVVPGWSAVQELGSANMVMVGARDLFPSRSVRLHGIKTFEKERIDLAILYAASILIEGCDTLRDVFMNIIQNQTEILFPVENLTCEVGAGFTGWIEHNRVIIGNRQMMQKHDIELPSLDYEQRYTKGTRHPIYLAVSGKLFGMFVVSYRPDENAAQVLQQLHHAGISVLVKSDDFSITAPMICRAYHLPKGFVKILSNRDRKDLAPATAYMPQSEGCMTHIGSFASMVGGLQAAAGAASGERSGSLVQTVSVAFSCVLALLLAFTGGMASLALIAVVLYQAAWSALALAMPLIKKY